MQRKDAGPVERLLAGAVATFVPHGIIEQFDFIRIGGGRGLFLFADADTLFFDAVLLASLVLLWRHRSMALVHDGVFWLVALTTLMVAGPLFYVVTNFGTLFRFRGMILAVIVLLPLAAASAARRTSAPAENRHSLPRRPAPWIHRTARCLKERKELAVTMRGPALWTPTSGRCSAFAGQSSRSASFCLLLRAGAARLSLARRSA